jgi:hypothetical protein
MKCERIKKILRDENPYAILHKNMDEALIGVFRTRNTVGVYSYLKFISNLVDMGKSEEEALIIYDQTLVNAQRDINNPIWVDDTGV